MKSNFESSRNANALNLVYALHLVHALHFIHRKWQKKESSLLHTYVLNEPPTVHEQQIIFEKTLIEVRTSHLYASFGTFCIKIGQFLEAQ